MHSDPRSPIQAQLAQPPGRSSPPHASATASSPGRGGVGPPSAASAWLHHRGAVLAMLFLVTGALGIPLLWMNAKFSTLERMVWSVVVTLYTVALIYAAYLIVMWSYRQILG